MEQLMRLLQFTDSAFPIGTFSFSNGLESAVNEKIVYDADTLSQYVNSAVMQAALCDGVASILSHRFAIKGDYKALVDTDIKLLQLKMNDETRMMTRRMGKKIAEIAAEMFGNSRILRKWLLDISADTIPGTYPVAQGIVYAIVGINEQALFASQQYGVANMILSAALRCMKVSHYDTQKILYRLSSETKKLYDKASNMSLNDIYSFAPEIDILASIHEKGAMRMFMN
jgi:urease accessory protein